jgi:CspA family cold shock protein
MNVATHPKENARLARGLVKWFNDCKGYGFIQSISDGEEVFVHHSEIADEEGYRSLVKGDQVQFEVVVTAQGAQASNVVKLPGQAPQMASANGFSPRPSTGAIRKLAGPSKQGERRFARA